jgi:hypothetical protein
LHEFQVVSRRVHQPWHSKCHEKHYFCNQSKAFVFDFALHQLMRHSNNISNGNKSVEQRIKFQPFFTFVKLSTSLSLTWSKNYADLLLPLNLLAVRARFPHHI